MTVRTEGRPDLDELLAHAGLVRATARAVLHGDAAVEDVVQETWLRAMEKAPARPRSLRAWVARVARNLALDVRRGSSRRRAREVAAARPEASPSVVEIAEREEARRRLVAALLETAEPYRSALLLRYYEGLPVRAVARRLDVPLETARTRLRRGLAHLREALGEGREGDRRAWMLPFAPLLGAPRGVPFTIPLLGAVAMKKALAVAAVALLLLGGAYVLDPFGWRAPGHDAGLRSAADARSAAPESQGPEAPLLRGTGGTPTPALPPPVDLATVDRALDLHGVVVRQADGKPVAGATLAVVTYPWRRANVMNSDAYDDVVEGPTTRSAVDGTFAIRLERGAFVSLRVAAEGFAPQERTALQAGERVRIEMDEGVHLTVVTKDAAGRPVAGTALRLSSHDDKAPALRGVTGADGRAVLGWAPGGTVYAVEVIPAQLGDPGWVQIALPERGEHVEEVLLEEGRTLTGRVLDRESGAPIPGATVGMGWVMLPRTASGPDGSYRLPGWLGKGGSDVHCVAHGYGREQWRVDGVGHDFLLSGGDVARGRLVASDGSVVSGAIVATVGSDYRAGEQQSCFRSGVSDAAGGFLVGGLRRDMPHTLIAMAPGFGRTLLDFDPHADGPGTIDVGDVVLPAARAIAGRVLGPDGQPIPRLEVSLSGANADRGRLRGVSMPGPGFYGTREQRTTDDLGRFRFPDLSSGEYTLSVRRGGSSPETRTVTLGAAEDVLDADIALPAARAFAVTVVDEAGAPIPSASVIVEADDGGSHALSDAQGRATLFLRGRGTSVRAEYHFPDRSLLPAEQKLTEQQDEVRLVLRKASTVSGHVLLPEGTPNTGVWIVAKRGDTTVATSLADGEGHFVLNVPPGEPLDVDLLGLNTGTGDIRLGDLISEPVRTSPGQPDVVLRVRRAPAERTLRVKVLLPDGGPAEGAVVITDRQGASTAADGIAVLRGLLPKRLSVTALPKADGKDVAAPVPVEVVPDGQEITLVLRKARPTGGIALLPSGEPAAGAQVALREGDRIRFLHRTGADGRFSFPIAEDEAGPWTIRCELPEQHLRGEVTDVRTGDMSVRLQLR